MTGVIWVILGWLSWVSSTGSLLSFTIELSSDPDDLEAGLDYFHILIFICMFPVLFLLPYGYAHYRHFPKRSPWQLAETIVDLIVLYGAVMVQLCFQKCYFGHFAFISLVTLFQVNWRFLGTTCLSLKVLFYRLTMLVVTFGLMDTHPGNNQVFKFCVVVCLSGFVLAYRYWMYMSFDYIDTWDTCENAERLQPSSPC